MEEKNEHLENEISDLKEELENFQKEKERVRAIIGKLGGVRSFQTRLINALFIVANPMPVKYAVNYAGFNVGKPRLPLT